MSRFNLVALFVVLAGAVALVLGIRGTYAQLGQALRGIPATPSAAASATQQAASQSQLSALLTPPAVHTNMTA